MTGQVDTLLIDVRASTDGFAEDIAAMRGTFDATLVDGFARAGDVLERGLLGAIRKGSLGFDDLRRIALNVIDDIAAQALNSLFAVSGGRRRAAGGWRSGGAGRRSAACSARCSGCPAAPPAVRFRRGAAISSASADRNCSCPRPPGRV